MKFGSMIFYISGCECNFRLIYEICFIIMYNTEETKKNILNLNGLNGNGFF